MNNFNLLPWREQAREAKRRRFYIHISIAILITIAIILLIKFSLQQQINHQKSRNHYLNNEIQQLNQNIQKMKVLITHRQDLLEQIKTLDQLQSMRPASVHLFDEIANTLPNGIYLTHLLQSDAHIHLVGKTKSNTHVSEYMNRLNQSNWLRSSNLKGISTRDENERVRHLRDFDLQVTLRGHHLMSHPAAVQP